MLAALTVVEQEEDMAVVQRLFGMGNVNAKASQVCEYVGRERWMMRTVRLTLTWSGALHIRGQHLWDVPKTCNKFLKNQNM